MGFMVPVAEKMTMFVVDTNSHAEAVPAEALSARELRVAKKLAKRGSGGKLALSVFAKYIEGNNIYSVSEEHGWYARLSAPGYMDATDWMGPYKSERAALKAVKDFHEVDDEGDDPNDA